jgi:pimeloyl-ACP methyl ester carboxylesterase
MNVVVDSMAVYYRQIGQGPPVLLLHGWGSEGAVFESLAKTLADDYQIIIPDLPGFGRSGPPPTGGWTVGQYTEFIQHFMKKLALGPVHAIVGHSLGGRIAICLVGTKKIEAEKLILISAHGIENPTNLRLRTYKVIAKTGKVLTAVLPGAWRRTLRGKLYSQAGAEDYLYSSPKMKATFRKIISEDLRPLAKRIDRPTLLIYGDQDEVTPVTFGRTYQTLISGSRLETIAGAGHFVFLDAPGQTEHLIKGFLR